MLATALARPFQVLVVSDEEGRVRWQVPATEGTAVVLQYTHSIYLAPTWERFVVRGGRLHLVDVSSTREAVLEYHRLAPPYRAEGGRLVAAISGVTLDGYVLRVGPRGHPTLQVGSRVLPLHAVGVGAAVRIVVRPAPRLGAWLHR
ncbi:MAG: hypothetical protein QN175_12785 [Armatimonadota bacterium]|nr:hypothetical protein [Armatimonadota bacterium]MDR7475868.1 hypothetical protein [Armatimonadota bacterium]